MAHVNFFIHYGNSVAFMLLLHRQTRILLLSIWSSLPEKITEANIREESLIVLTSQSFAIILAIVIRLFTNCERFGLKFLTRKWQIKFNTLSLSTAHDMTVSIDKPGPVRGRNAPPPPAAAAASQHSCDGSNLTTPPRAPSRHKWPAHTCWGPFCNLLSRKDLPV